MGLMNWALKNPFEAAALGAGAYLTGGAALGAMGGAGAAAPVLAGAEAAPILGGAVATPVASGAAGGWVAGAGGAPATGSGLLGSSLQAMQAAGMAKGLLGSQPQQQIQGGQLPQASNGINDALQMRQQAYADYMKNRRL